MKRINLEHNNIKTFSDNFFTAKDAIKYLMFPLRVVTFNFLYKPNNDSSQFLQDHNGLGPTMKLSGAYILDKKRFKAILEPLIQAVKTGKSSYVVLYDPRYNLLMG